MNTHTLHHMIQRLTVLLILTNFSLQAQDGRFGLGARSAGMGQASVTIEDTWSIFNNPGGLHSVEKLTGLFSYQNRYGQSAFGVVGAAVVSPLSFGTAGVSVFRFGDDIFNQQKISLAFSNKFGLVGLGANVSYLQYNIESLGNRGLMVIDFGGVAEITKQLFFGAHIFNLNQATLSEETDESVPTVMKAGLSYRPTEALMFNVEVEKDLDFEALFKAGIEYQIIENLFARTGINTTGREVDAFISAFGLGYIYKKFWVDYAYSNNNKIGDIHELSIAYNVR